jgi:hypothetical protein
MHRLHHAHPLFGILLLVTLVGSIFPSTACTVFILTKGKHAYFFNNEDFTNPNTRIWFVPKGAGYYGAAYVGFNNGEAQGGFNTKGLVFEWVTVDGDSYVTDSNYVPEQNLIRLDVNTSQWMLERCKTVEEAIKFYQTYKEPAFARSTLVIADKSGASVIIGSKNGKIYFDKSHESRGLGFGETIFQQLYKAEYRTDPARGAQILKQCVAPGEGGTKYSNSYNLKTGEITFYNFSNDTTTKFYLSDELKKGQHYYETSKIAEQISQPVQPLMLNMNRHILYIHKPLSDQEPMVTAKIENLFSEIANGKLLYDDLSESFTNDLRKAEDIIKNNYGRFGKLISLTLILKEKHPEFTDYSYVMKFEKVTILWQFLLNNQNKIYDFNTLSVSWIQ